MGLIDTEKLQRFYNNLKTQVFEVTSPSTLGEATFASTDNLSEHIGKIEFQLNDIYNKIYILANIISDSGVTSTELTDLITELEAFLPSSEPDPEE